jgi:hypothetical protein
MEQTSSVAYPNTLVADYVKKARVATPEILMKAENFLNIGYQKLLTIERPGGGFDWWGSGPPTHPHHFHTRRGMGASLSRKR